ncbi:MAG: phenylalanine--tRNA ligase subunit alpha, partial [Lachnospiraceae bacterium]|nr:phenylalanine--tRNA ligase subunit alpha [Lachnospiraceae bacterium]
MSDTLQELRDRALAQIKEGITPEKLEEARVAFLGKKGELTAMLKSMKDLSAEERPKFGQAVNDLRSELETAIDEAKRRMKSAMRAEQLKAEAVDVTLPAKRQAVGHRHPNSLALTEIERIFIGMGYEVVRSTEIEKDYYNFEALNIPADHPAKDEQDTFYLGGDFLLRTQTSGAQVHEMEKGRIPIKMISPGRVFRSDEVDATHSPVFHQVEGLLIDKDITFADLKGTLAV